MSGTTETTRKRIHATFLDRNLTRLHPRTQKIPALSRTYALVDIPT